MFPHWLIPPGYAQPTVGGQKEQQDHHHSEPPLATPRKNPGFFNGKIVTSSPETMVFFTSHFTGFLKISGVAQQTSLKQ